VGVRCVAVGDWAEDGQELGGACKACDLLHLGQVLVREREAVDSRRIKGRGAVLGLVASNHFLAAARVSRKRIAGDGVIGRHDAHAHERGRGGDETRGMAARIGDALACGDGRALPGGELGKAIGPALGGAMGRRGVDDAGLGVLYERDCLDGTLVRQAQKDDVGGIDELVARILVVALVIVDAQKLKVLPRADAVVDLETGGPALTVDVHPGLAHANVPPR